ncbi:amidohydrolase [Bacillus sp. JCM 19041]|uniref:amidohydrolase n=1 Tax=Bacillus sp. JCM 19041 TaxID=1460637 RepID=UPI000A68CE24
MSKEMVTAWLENEKQRFEKMAKDIWDHPQIAYEETYAASLQMKQLETAGFSVQANVAGIETAFVAEYGAGKPILGVMGEYDALPGLSQAVSPTYEPLEEDGPGHGCGHNLLGTAGVAAVLALKEQMGNGEISGTIRYYGCPAEEVLSGKSFMARTGVFDDLDCVLTWHPGSSNLVVNMSMQSAASVKFHFKGITAHAAGAPHAGRSALDAVEIMNVGANYLREHVVDGTRIHYVITNGGLAPNVVPEEASVWYYVRGASKEAVEEVLERVKKMRGRCRNNDGDKLCDGTTRLLL